MSFCQSFHYKYYTGWESSPELHIHSSPPSPNKFLLDTFQKFVGFYSIGNFQQNYLFVDL